MRALLTGILGMDGFHMTELLHSKCYLIYGIIKKGTKPERLIEIKNLVPGIILFKADITKKSELEEIIKKVQPDEMYNFAAVSDVIYPYDKVGEVMEVNGRAPRYMLECISEYSPHTKFFQASSRLVFGDAVGGLNELSNREPTLPYGAAKLYADKYISKYREYGLYACSGIFFNHESERRPDRFFSRKVSKSVASIKMGKSDRVFFGNLNSFRDMGYARDYMYAAWLMMQQNHAEDFVIGTGEVVNMGEFACKAFSYEGLRLNDYWVCDESLVRIDGSCYADTSKIRLNLQWTPHRSIDDIIKVMIDHDISLLQKQNA